MTTSNRRWVLESYPDGMPTPDNWRMETVELNQPAENQVLARALYLSVDPYMRGRISARKGYAKGVRRGELMVGGAVAEVIQSNHPDFKQGDIVESMHFGWQEYASLDAKGLTRVDLQLGPAHAWLSYLGMPGITAWCALTLVGNIKTGETVLVSAASGAVGQVAGALLNAAGCRAVAVASSELKLNWCRQIGYASGINYRESENLTADVTAACNDGIDVFFDNTAGAIHDAAMQNLAIGARIIVVGTISLSGKFEQPDLGERFLRQILVARATMTGFLVFDHLDRYDEARRHLANLANSGRLKFNTDFMDGIDSMPEAFMRLMHSKNFGKQLVRTRFASGMSE